MFALLFFLLGCWSDQGLTHEVIKEVEVVVSDTAYVEVEGEVEAEGEVEVEVLVPEQYPLWVQSVVQPKLANGIDRSGVLGIFMDVNNSIERLTNNSIGLILDIFWS